MLYTIVSDFDGNTFVDQCHQDNLEDVLSWWLRNTAAPVKIENIDEMHGYSKLNGVKNVWCSVFSDKNDVFYTLNIVATNEEKI